MSIVKLCCGQEHTVDQVMCNDGKVMCCMCFERFGLKDLAPDPSDGLLTDVCKKCAAIDLHGVMLDE